MSDLEDKLSAILGNPQAMSQIMSLAQSLGGGAPAAGGDEHADAPPPPPPSTASTEPVGDSTAAAGPASSPSAQVPDLSGLLGALSGGGGGGLDPRLLTLASRVMQEYQSEDDSRTVLLNSLRPFVKEKRYAKIDKAIQIARLSRLIRVALDVFKGGDHV